MSSDKNGTNSTVAVQEYYQDEENLKKLCNFLRTKHGPVIREGTLMETRVSYLKGEKLTNFLYEPKKGTKWPARLPRFKSRQEAIAVCRELVKLNYMIRAEKRGKGELGVSRVREFDEGGYFVWMYEGDKTLQTLMTTALIIGFLLCVCFPIWPMFLRVWVWYLSITFLLFLLGMISLRGFAFLCFWLIGYEFWFLPNLFDESLGFYDSFKPVTSWEKTKSGQLLYRVGVGMAFFGFCYWAVTQPSEFDGMLTAQGDFLKDLYAGTLLSDMSQADKENIDKPKIQTLDDLLKELDREDDEIVKENISPLNVELNEEEQVDSMLNSLLDEDGGSEDHDEL